MWAQWKRIIHRGLFQSAFQTKSHVKTSRDFPGGPVVKNPPANAVDTGSIPGLRRFHMPQSNKTHVPQPRSLHSRAHTPQEKPVRPNGVAAHLLQLEKVHAQQQRPSSHK